MASKLSNSPRLDGRGFLLPGRNLDDPDVKRRTMGLVYDIWRLGGYVLPDNTSPDLLRGLLTDIISPVYSDKTYRQHPYERIACWTGEEGKPLAWQNLLHKYGEVDMLDGKRQAADADVHITTEETARGEFAKGMPRVRACFVGREILPPTVPPAFLSWTLGSLAGLVSATKAPTAAMQSLAGPSRLPGPAFAEGEQEEMSSRPPTPPLPVSFWRETEHVDFPLLKSDEEAQDATDSASRPPTPPLPAPHAFAMESDKGPHSSASGEQSKEDSPAHPRSTSLPSLPRLAIQPTIARLRISGLTNVPGMADESPLTTAPSSPTDQRAEWLSAEENAGSEGDETEGGEPAGDAGEGASQMGDADGPVGSDPCICHVDEECHCRDVLEGVFDGDDPKDRTYQGVEVTGTADDCSASDDDSDSESDSSSSTGSESTACSTDREGNRVSVDRRASRERSSGSDSVGGGSLAEVEGGEEEEDGVRGEEQGEQVEDVEDDGPSRKRRKTEQEPLFLPSSRDPSPESWPETFERNGCRFRLPEAAPLDVAMQPALLDSRRSPSPMSGGLSPMPKLPSEGPIRHASPEVHAGPSRSAPETDGFDEPYPGMFDGF